MPAQQRLGRDHEASPALTRQQSREGCEQHAISPLELRPAGLSGKDLHLLAQDQDLGLSLPGLAFGCEAKQKP
jgi:hypothetical protein